MEEGRKVLCSTFDAASDGIVNAEVTIPGKCTCVRREVYLRTCAEHRF